MKRTSWSFLAVLFLVSLCCSESLAGPKVAVVKTDIAKSTAEDYKFSMAILNYDFSKPVDKILKNESTWGPESQAAIEKVVREAIKLSGDWPVKPGQTVFVKPNLVVGPRTMQGMNRLKSEEILATMTDARVARAVALVALESGASKVMFGDIPSGGDSYATAKGWGYEAVVDELNAKFPGKAVLMNLNAVPYKYYKPKNTGGLALKEYAIPEIFVNTDVIISVPKLKTHSFAGMSGSLKNIGMGVPINSVYGQSKWGLPHRRLPEVVVDVCDIVKISYTVVDAIWAMEGNGPALGNPLAMNVIIAGKDPVAVDWTGCELMGIRGDSIGIVRLAKNHKLGTYEDVEIVGTPIKQAMQQFEPVPRANRVPGPGGYSHNVGWGPDAVK